jgi:hypothetical protein
MNIFTRQWRPFKAQEQLRIRIRWELIGADE